MHTLRVRMIQGVLVEVEQVQELAVQVDMALGIKLDKALKAEMEKIVV